MMIEQVQKQNILQKQAYEVIEILNLKSILSKYGELFLVGSIEYGLMTWRDIDINLVTKNDPTDSEYWDIVRSVFSLPNVWLSFSDNRQQIETNRPKSMYLGIKYKDDEKNNWKIDIRILAKESITTDKIAHLIKEKMTEESRESILDIKSQVHNNPNYHKKFSSVDIYEAVLLSSIKDLDGFKDYLSKIGKCI